MIKLLRLYEELNRIDTSKFDEKDRRFLEANSYSNEEVVINGIARMHEVYNIKPSNLLNFYSNGADEIVFLNLLKYINIEFDTVYIRFRMSSSIDVFIYSSNSQILYSLRLNNVTTIDNIYGRGEFLEKYAEPKLMSEINSILDANDIDTKCYSVVYDFQHDIFHVDFEDSVRRKDISYMYDLWDEIASVGNEFGKLFSKFSKSKHYLILYGGHGSYYITVNLQNSISSTIEEVELE